MSKAVAPAPGVEFYDERYKAGYMQDWPPAKIDRVRRLISEFGLPAQGRALDFGCGAGLFTRALADALPGWTIVGADISPTALEHARRHEQRATFCLLSDLRGAEPFDFVFSHHVLEHVPDIEATADEVVSVARRGASMLHIMPCGDPGSFEFRVCNLRQDGFQASGGCFFFEEEGHLRRMKSQELASLWTRRGFRIKRLMFSNQFMGAVMWLTDRGLGEVMEFAKPGAARSFWGRMQLWGLRLGLTGYWCLRVPQRVVQHKKSRGIRTVRDAIVLAPAIVLYPFSALAEWSGAALAEREWKKKSAMPGSEMYLFVDQGVRP
jgi:SAM-dependent methyltransferase